MFVLKNYISDKYSVAILELKMWGDHYGANGKRRGPTEMCILHGDISLFRKLIFCTLPYQTQHRLVNVVKDDLALLFTKRL